MVNDDDTYCNDERPPNPLKDATLASTLLFDWAWPLLKLGSARPLEEADLPQVHPHDSSAYNRSYIDRIWKQCQQERKSLARGLLQDFFQTTIKCQFLLAMNSAARIGQAVALGLLMEQFSSSPSLSTEGDNNYSTNKNNGYIWSGVMVFCGLIAFLTKQRLYFEMHRKGLQLRVGIIAKLYEKTLILSSITTNAAASSLSSGQLTNLASNDVERFLMAAVPSLFITIGPFEAIAILLIGIQVIGPVFAIGHALFLFLIPVQFYLGRQFRINRSKVAAYTDARVTLVGQAVSGARIMKMNGWEYEFEKRIAMHRSREISKLKRTSRYKALNEAVSYFSSVVAAVIIFAFHVGILGGTLTPRSVYTCLSLLNILHLSLSKQIPSAVMNLSECYISSKRIQNFLELPDVTDDNIYRGDDDRGEREQNMISLSHVSCFWDDNGENDTNKNEKDSVSKRQSNAALVDLSLSFEMGKLYCISGKVGCGKTALLLTLSGELKVSNGTVIRKYSSLGYAAQNAWIMNGSIKENITMGLPFKKEWYNKVVDACGLRLDFDHQFFNGDQTVVGDRGVQCSGGQRSRIGLARVFYKDPEVLLLDDPLSAVDTTVARSIYRSAIQELGVKRGKCVVLTTHQLEFIQEFDECIVLDKGKILSRGSTYDYTVNTISTEMFEDQTMPSSKEKKPLTESKMISNSAQEESRSTGVIEWEIWKRYGKAVGGPAACLILFFLYTLTQSILLLTIVQVGTWAEAPSELQRKLHWFGIVFGLVLALVFLSITRARLTFYTLIKASSKLHDIMLHSVLRSKIDFFDTNPLGRILNRFSADVGISDEALPLTIHEFLVGAFIALGGVITASAVLPFILLALPPLIWSFLRLRRTFINTTRELKRLEGMARSPIFALMSESLQGIATIRTNDSTNYFKKRFEQMHDAHTRAYFAFVASSRWFATRMDILAFALMSATSILAVLFHTQDWFKVNPAVLGLALTLLLQIAGTNFPFIVRQSAEIVNQMISVERLLEFGDQPPEAPLELEFDKFLDEDWPANGEICFRDLAVRYRPELPLTLDQLTLSVPAGSRVGVVGRTGSGKSTLCQTLFRLLEADHGLISIDGIDISKVGLHRLRKSISVIPQMPTLFSGCSVRENLDLFNVHDDEIIKKALKDVHMGEISEDLDAMVSEGGSNFSVGQRQLLCLARANLCKNKLLVLDEATASVDKETDQLLHKALSKTYKDATIMAIAHRLDTVIDYDYILVLGEGKALEFGSPADLIKSAGIFSKMLDNAGENIANSLHKRAFFGT